jgi:hypothetical protein
MALSDYRYAIRVSTYLRIYAECAALKEDAIRMLISRTSIWRRGFEVDGRVVLVKSIAAGVQPGTSSLPYVPALVVNVELEGLVLNVESYLVILLAWTMLATSSHALLMVPPCFPHKC